MQQESEFDIIRGKLADAAETSDSWNKTAAWSRLEGRLQSPRKQLSPAWWYTGAAAALLLIGVFIGQQMQRPSTPLAAAPVRPPSATPALAPVASDSAVPATEPIATPSPTQTMVTGIPAPPPVSQEKELAAEELVIATKENVTASDSAPVTIYQQLSAPTVVYTLNEIMDNVPEREAPPRNYTGIFKLRPIQENENRPARENAQRLKFEFEPPVN